MKLPIFNNTNRNFTRRDSLGLQSLSTSIQARICPIINVVTPRPFYWAFLVWNYYHYYSLPENKNTKDSVFDNAFVKRNDFFLLLGKYINNKNVAGVAGNQNTSNKFSKEKDNEEYAFYAGYYRSRFGGMQYYNNGCFAMGFVPENRKTIDLNKDTPGARLTKAIDDLIKDTAYYQEYILKNKNLDVVQRETIIEFSNCFNYDLENMDEVRNIIHEALFSNKHLSFAEQYLKLLIENGLINKDESFNAEKARELLYGDYQPIILDKAKVDDHLKTAIIQWELIVANQYYVTCMEILWKYLLSLLDDPCTQKQWIDKALMNASDLDLEAPLSSFNNELTFKEMEANIHRNLDSKTIYSALSILMSIYNRYKKRLSDLDFMPQFASKKRDSFTVFSLIKSIKNNTFKNVGDLLRHLLKNHIIERHQDVATIKQYQGRDGFLYELSDGLYAPIPDGKVNRTIDISMRALRIVNVFYVLRDLGKL